MGYQKGQMAHTGAALEQDLSKGQMGVTTTNSQGSYEGMPAK